MQTLAEGVESLKIQIYSIRDQYYDELKRKFFQEFDVVPYGGFFQIYVEYHNRDAHAFELAMDQFKKTTRGFGFRVMDIRNDSTWDGGSEKSITIKREDEPKTKGMKSEVGSSRCVIS
jgi:hypothetical protein